jgi:hypothetical protein
MPHFRYLERLHKRNNFLIDSHHPLRETLIAQTGATELLRYGFLNKRHKEAKFRLNQYWVPVEELEAAF